MEPTKKSQDSLKKQKILKLGSKSDKYVTKSSSKPTKDKTKVNKRKQKLNTDSNFRLKRKTKYEYKQNIEAVCGNSESTIDQDRKDKQVQIKETNIEEEKDSESNNLLKTKTKWRSSRAEYYKRIIQHYLPTDCLKENKK